VEVDDRHVKAWQDIAERAEGWLGIHHFANETPTEARQRRSRDLDSLSWSEFLAQPPDLWLPNLPFEFALEDSSGDVLIAIELERARCPAAPSEPAAGIGIARAAMPKVNGAALALLREIPDFVLHHTGSVEHVVAEVCTKNSRSLRLMERAGWGRVGDDTCEYHHRELDCSQRSEVFCSHA
jgi:hypothetical protein